MHFVNICKSIQNLREFDIKQWLKVDQVYEFRQYLHKNGQNSQVNWQWTLKSDVKLTKSMNFGQYFQKWTKSTWLIMNSDKKVDKVDGFCQCLQKATVSWQLMETVWYDWHGIVLFLIHCWAKRWRCYIMQHSLFLKLITSLHYTEMANVSTTCLYAVHHPSLQFFIEFWISWQVLLIPFFVSIYHCYNSFQSLPWTMAHQRKKGLRGL